MGDQKKKAPPSTKYDLEDRTLDFSRRINEYVRGLNKDLPNKENSRQLIRSGGSVGANYIEANEATSKKDFRYRIKISRKEAKEARYWLKLTSPSGEAKKEQSNLIQEATEFIKIFTSILKNSA